MEFKPRLEKIIKEVIVVSEVATIAEEVQLLEESGENLDEVEFKSATVVEQHRTNHNNRTGGWKGVTFRHNNNHEEGGGGGTTAAAASVSSMDDEEDEEDDSYRNARRATFRGTRPQLSTTESGSWRIKKFLDRWEDPVDKSERDPEVTIADVLKFRTALSYMDLTHPFGEAFGPASSRDECIESANILFYALLKFTPQKTAIPFETLALITGADEGGTVEDSVKKRDLQKVFRPDAWNELTKLAFIQSIDAVYRKLRFFRASVGNASVIDKVLEDIINGIFYFVLGLVLLSLMHFNPWPLLVSMTSLLVSVSFALGSSVSKYVEVRWILSRVCKWPCLVGESYTFSSLGPSAGMVGSFADCGSSSF